MSAEHYEIPTWECLDLLRSESIGRICIIEHGYPLALPVNYRIIGTQDASTVVIRTARDTMIGRYEGLTSLEVDEITLQDGTAWSVIVRGSLRRVIGGHSLPDPMPIITEGRYQWVTLDVASISGRRFITRPADDGFSVEWQTEPSVPR